MTRERIYGSDPVWGQWVRSLGVRGGPLPSASDLRGTTVNDWDLILHQYKTPVDNQGTRDVHCLMFVECKTRMAEVASTQTETLWLWHQGTKRKYQAKLVNSKKRVAVWNYGASVLRCDSDDPATATWFDWGRFDDNGRLFYRQLDTASVIELLAFDREPDTLALASFRRHHKVRHLTRTVRVPLGFEVYEHYKQSS